MSRLENICLLSDANENVVEGFRMVFSKKSKHAVCFSHVKSAVEREIVEKNLVQYRDEILKDVEAMHDVVSAEEFLECARERIQKWLQLYGDEKIKEFVEHFEKIWLKKFDVWHSGVFGKEFRCDNDNVNEFFQRLKTEHKVHFRMILSTVMDNLLDIADDCSCIGREIYDKLNQPAVKKREKASEKTYNDPLIFKPTVPREPLKDKTNLKKSQLGPKGKRKI